IYAFAVHEPERAPVRITGPRAAILHLEFSPDGETLALAEASAGFGLQLWKGREAVPGRNPLLATHRPPLDAGILGQDFAPNGDLYVTTRLGWLSAYRSAEGYLRQEQYRLESIPFPMRPRVSPDGKHLAVGSELGALIGIVDLDNPQQVAAYPAPT